MSALILGGALLGFCLGKRALDRHLINGVTGVVALLIIICFAFTMMVGWCQFLRYSENGSLLFSSWYLLLFSAWLGLFSAAVMQAWREMRASAAKTQFSSLRDHYVIVYDDPHNEGKQYRYADTGREMTEDSGGKDDPKDDPIVTPFG